MPPILPRKPNLHPPTTEHSDLPLVSKQPDVKPKSTKSSSSEDSSSEDEEDSKAKPSPTKLF